MHARMLERAIIYSPADTLLLVVMVVVVHRYTGGRRPGPGSAAGGDTAEVRRGTLPSYSSPSFVIQMEHCHSTSSSLMTHITWRENGEKCMCMMTYMYFLPFVYM